MEPDFQKLSFEKAVRLLKGWGFLVEQGPRPGEVTLILEGSTRRSYYVCEPDKLLEMAAAILHVRWCTGAMMARLGCSKN
ncbi:MAG TPA: hypothetical protein VEK32_05360 [Thermodesulfobacteriota bacterium]|nr:hypothetical protein [Thermodesulfobacteriota bacterium]